VGYQQGCKAIKQRVRRDYLFPLPEIELLILQLVKVISISVNSLRGASLADDCHTTQTWTKLSPSGSQKMDSFLLRQLGLGAAVKQTVKRNGHYVEVRCVPCATCVPCSHRSSRNVVGIMRIVETSLYFWQLRVGH